MEDASAPQSGMTIDGVPIPLHIEAAGPDAITAHLAGVPAVPAPPVIETAANPPAQDEGDEA